MRMVFQLCNIEEIRTLSPLTNSQELQLTAKKWASAAINTYEGELLRRALAISAAISDFNSYKS